MPSGSRARRASAHVDARPMASEIPFRPWGHIDESALALEGMWMGNPGEYPPVQFRFDGVNSVRRDEQEFVSPVD